MLSGIDHVVVLVQDLPQAIGSYESLGFTVTPGGEHAGGATHNGLIGFDDGTYFELIAFKEPEREQDHRWWPRLRAGEGLVDYALVASNAAEVIGEAGSRGVALNGPADGSRHRPDGKLIAWRSVTSGLPIGASPLPFAIEDVTPRETRVPNGAAATHRNNASGVAEVVIVVRDISAAVRDLAAMLGTGAVSGRSENEAVFTTGQQRLRLLQPTPQISHDGIGLSPAEHLETRGEGPYEVILSLSGATDLPAGTLLPATPAHGARIRMGVATSHSW